MFDKSYNVDRSVQETNIVNNNTVNNTLVPIQINIQPKQRIYKFEIESEEGRRFLQPMPDDKLCGRPYFEFIVKNECKYEESFNYGYHRECKEDIISVVVPIDIYQLALYGKFAIITYTLDIQSAFPLSYIKRDNCTYLKERRDCYFSEGEKEMIKNKLLQLVDSETKAIEG